MYITRFGIDQNPFGSTPNPRFFFASETHRRALSELLYSLRSQRGLAVVVGDSGSGKSTLINVAISSTNEEINVIRVDFSQPNRESLIDYLAAEFGLAQGSIGERLRNIKNKIVSDFLRGQRHVLLHECTQQMDEDVLSFLLELTQVTVANVRPITVILSGDYGLKALVEGHPQAAQHTLFVSELGLLSHEETVEYVLSRLRQSGVTGELFSQNALEQLYSCTDGLPSKINAVCEVAILSAVSEEKNLIDGDDVGQAIIKLFGAQDKQLASQSVKLRAEQQHVSLHYQEEGEQKHFLLQKKTTRLGRDAVNDLVIQDEKASRFHAKIVKNGDRYFLLDLLSSNRTLLNGSPIKNAMLNDGDTIQIGRQAYAVGISKNNVAENADTVAHSSVL